jgi:hypothetical protein
MRYAAIYCGLEETMNYHLYPPFLVVPEESDFPDAWESFCCKLLNLSEKTAEIYRRTPPEQGIDLLYPSKHIAYQCKSVESGKSGDFNLSNALASIAAAKKVQSEVGWKKYVLCTNVDITGTTEKKLKEALPDIILMPRSHWLTLCEEYSDKVERNFRVLLTIPPQRVLNTIDQAFYSNYSVELKKMLADNPFDIFLYSNRHEKVYRIPVASEFKVEDLLHLLRWFFKLPESRTISAEDISVSLSHALVFNGKKQILSDSLADIGITSGSVITYWTTFVWSEESATYKGELIHDVMEYKTLGFVKGRSLEERVERAMRAFSESVQEAFMEFDTTLEESPN